MQITKPESPTNCADVDPAIFFDPALANDAIQFCVGCWFQPQCAEMGKNEDYGVWGGDVKVEPVLFEDLRPNQQAVISRWNESLDTQAEVAIRVGVNRTTVIRTLSKYANFLTRPVKTWTPEQMWELSQEGLDNRAIAKRVGKSPEAVAQALLRHRRKHEQEAA